MVIGTSTSVPVVTPVTVSICSPAGESVRQRDADRRLAVLVEDSVPMVLSTANVPSSVSPSSTDDLRRPWRRPRW